MRKIIVVAGLLLLWTQAVEAQCTGYTITSTGVNLLSTTDAAKQGNVTTTITAIAVDSSGNPLPGAIPSKSLTVTQGTYVKFTWKTSNATSAFGTYWEDNANQQTWQGGLSGSATWGPWPDGDVGHRWNFQYTATGANGTTTTDRMPYVSIVAGNTPGIIFQDGVWTNAYYQLITKFSGGSMLNQCSECQTDPTKCINQTHTPLFDATLTNQTSGETQTISDASAGNVVRENESLSGSSSIMISVLPGDTPSGTTTDKVFCTMFGWIMAQQWNPGIPDVEFAVTEEEIIPSTCTLVLRFFQQGDDWGINCNVAWKKPPATADRCSVASQIPDFNPAAQWDEQNCKVPGNCNASDMPPPNGTNASYPKYWYHASWGVRFPPGAPSPDPPIINGGAHNWTFPIYLAEGYVPAGPNQDWWILDLLNLAIPKGTGLPIDCTNRDKHTSPIPNPF